jgi:hypothetical protein
MRFFIKKSKMNQVVYFWVFFFLIYGVSNGTAQEWKTTEFNRGDTLVSTETYVDVAGEPIADSTRTHQIVSEYKNYYLLKSERFGLNGERTEDKRGIHKKVIFLKKFLKFYNKEGKPLREVKEPYYYEQSNATYSISKYNEHGDLLEVCFYKDNVIVSGVTGIYIRKRSDAVESYTGMTHKYQFRYFRKRKVIKEYQYNIRGDYTEMRILKRIKTKKKKKTNKKK